MRIGRKIKNGGGLGLMLAPSAVVAAFSLCLGMRTVGRTGEAWQTAPTATVIALAVAAVAMPLVALAARSVFGTNKTAEAESLGERLMRWATVAVTAVAAACVGIVTLREGAAFVLGAMEIEAGRIAVAAVLLGAGAFVATRGDVAIKSFGLAAIFFALTSTVFLFLLALLGGASAEGLLGSVLSSGEDTGSLHLGEVLEILIGVFAPSAVGVIWLCSVGRDGKRGLAGGSALGAAIGGGMLLLAFWTVVLTLGGSYGFDAELPYMAAVGSMTAGKLFLRPEGLIYLSYIWLNVLVLSVCISAASLVLRGGERTRKGANVAVAAILLVLYGFLG